MPEHSLYDVCLCANFGGDGCDGTDTLGTDAVSETTLRSGAGWGTTTVDCGVNSNVNVGEGKVELVVSQFLVLQE